ncbi:MAG: hypothetical protein KME05_10285 [Gloeocapsa sp. UFS-A4-WI-NPMV-4B04]|jgi:hypothetical protein|nr:hypothetical protein [Gloeocapsa sp. UFS-A4-WI-NPMV-4B04]
MQKKQVHLASLVAGFLMLGIPSAALAQITHLTQNVTNVQQARRSAKPITGVIESFSGIQMKVRLSDGSVKTYPVSRQIFDSLSLNEGTVILFDADTDLILSTQEKPIYAFKGRITDIKNNQLTVMLTSGQVRTIPIQPEFAAQLKKLQRLPGVPVNMQISGIVHENSPLSDINSNPSTVTTVPNSQVARRILQARTAKATYEDLMEACKSRGVQFSRLNALQDIANNVVEFDRIEVVDINEVLKGQNVQAFQQLHAKHTKAEHLILEDSLNNISVMVPNTNKIMKLKQALLNLNVKPESVINVRVRDIIYGKLFVFYDSTAQ